MIKIHDRIAKIEDAQKTIDENIIALKDHFIRYLYKAIDKEAIMLHVPYNDDNLKAVKVFISLYYEVKPGQIAIRYQGKRQAYGMNSTKKHARYFNVYIRA